MRFGQVTSYIQFTQSCGQHVSWWAISHQVDAAWVRCHPFMPHAVIFAASATSMLLTDVCDLPAMMMKIHPFRSDRFEI
eukprot:scaffold91753_cov23-Prasinocladus_malaysianus.AAC.1